MGMFMIFFFTICHVFFTSVSLVITMNTEAKEDLCIVAILLFHVLLKCYLSKS
jgi:hypothetical protein